MDVAIRGGVLLTRALAGIVLAGALALAARRARSLSTGGGVAAVVVGASAVIGGWAWVAALLTFFVTSTALSRYRREARDARIADIVEKGDERDAWQVLANGGVFAAAALLSLSGAPAVWLTVGFGALAAATADTWATEIGTLAGHAPRSIVSLESLPAGTSGGVTVPGLVASLLGAGTIAVVAYLSGAALPAAVLAGGFAGSLADSVAGATVQERRWCDRCSRSTERLIHSCGTPTRRRGGVPGLRNDLVNVVCTIVGGAVAVLVTR